MNKLRKLALACAFSIVAPAASAASVSGLDFESGSLGNWIGSGTAVHDPLMAYQGDWYGQLEGNQGLFGTVSLSAGQRYEFMWRFIAGDYLPYNDSAFVVTDGGYNLLASVASGFVSLSRSLSRFGPWRRISAGSTSSWGQLSTSQMRRVSAILASADTAAASTSLTASAR